MRLVWVKDPRHPAAGGTGGYVQARWYGRSTPDGRYEVFVDYRSSLYVDKIFHKEPENEALQTCKGVR